MPKVRREFLLQLARLGDHDPPLRQLDQPGFQWAAIPCQKKREDPQVIQRHRSADCGSSVRSWTSFARKGIVFCRRGLYCRRTRGSSVELISHAKNLLFRPRPEACDTERALAASGASWEGPTRVTFFAATALSLLLSQVATLSPETKKSSCEFNVLENGKEKVFPRIFSESVGDTNDGSQCGVAAETMASEEESKLEPLLGHEHDLKATHLHPHLDSKTGNIVQNGHPLPRRRLDRRHLLLRHDRHFRRALPSEEAPVHARELCQPR